MTEFKLDPRLERDCHNMTTLQGSRILLMNNALVPWFIIVPETKEQEVIDLETAERLSIYKQIEVISYFVRNHFKSEKLNTAWIGNVVSQLHIHIVGRKQSDPFWPDVVWGQQETKQYTEEKVAEIRSALLSSLKEKI